MKNFLKNFIVLTLFLVSSVLFASQKQADNIAGISAVSLYNIDKNALQNTIKAYIKSNPNLEALKVVESLSGDTYIEFYKKGGETIYENIPESFSNDISKFKTVSKYENEVVGEITAYFKDRTLSLIEENKIAFNITEERWLKQNPVITIAVVDNYAPYDFRDEKNELVGFHTDLSKLINENLGTNIKLKAYPTWKEAFYDASNGNVHGIFSLSWSQEREDKYFFYSPVYHFSPYHLVVKKDNNEISSLSNLTNKNIAIERDTIFKSVVEEKNPLAKVVLVDNTQKTYESVAEGETLATISPNIKDELFHKSGLKVVSEIFHKSSNLYIGTNKKYPTVSSILTKGIDSISAKELSDLRKKWIVKNKTLIDLSLEEKKWMDNHPVITVGSLDNYPPYSFSSKNGVPQGVAIDFINKLAKIAGLNIKFDEERNWGKLFEKAKDKQVDILTSVTPKQEREKWFLFTDPYISISKYIITRKEDNSIKKLSDIKEKTVAVNLGFTSSQELLKEFPSINPYPVNNSTEAMHAVSSGKADAAISSLGITDHIMKKELVNNLKFATSYRGETVLESFAIRDDWPELKSILNKALETLDRKQKLEILGKWISPEILEIDKKTIQERAFLSVKDKIWIKENPVIKIIKFFDEPPFTINTQQKSGYVYELIEYLINSTGLEIDYIDGFKSYGQMLDSLEKGNVDMLTTFPTSLDLGESSNIVKSKSILRTPFVLIGSNNNGHINSVEDLFGKKVAVVKGYVQDKYLSEFPQIQKVYVNNNEEGFDAIRSGKAKYYINNRANSEYVLNKSFSTDLDIVFELPYDKFPPLSISFAMNGKKDRLVSILNKSLSAIPYKTIKDIKEKWIVTEEAKKQQKITLTEKEKKWLNANPTIRLAYMNFWTSDDNNENVHTEYIKLLSKYGNINILPVKFNAWKDGFEAASEGRGVQGILKLSWSKEREEHNFNYTKPYSFTPAYVIVKKSNNSIGSMKDLSGKNIYVKEKTITSNIVRELKYNISPIELSNEGEMYKALEEENSKADAILSYVSDPELLEKHNLKVASEFFSRYGEVHLGVSKNQEELYSIINKIFEIIPKNELRQIQSRTYKKTKKTRIELTKEEKEFIKKHPKIRVHNEKTWAPFNFYEKGRARGLSIDYIKALLENVGIEVEFITGPSWNEFIEMSKSKEIDLMLNIAKSPQREEFLNFTTSYFDISQSVFIKNGSTPVSKVEDLFGKTFAVPKGFYYEEVLKKYPQVKLLKLEDTLECIQAVSSGKAYAMLDLITVVNYYKNKYNIKNVVLGGTLGIEGGSLPLHMGVRKDWTELVSILNKSISALSDDDISDIEDKWLFNNREAKKSLIPLTKKEKKWIRENVVRVGIEEWAPVVFSHGGKDFDGITGDVLRLVIERTGLNIQVTNDLWDPLLNKFKNKELDLLPATYYTEERATYGLYTDGYYKMLDYIYVKEDNRSIRSLDDLKGKTLAIPKGFGTIPKIKKNFPKIEIVETLDLSDSMQRVLRGEVDALYDGQIAVEYKMQEDLIVGLRGIPQDSFKAAPLHFFSNIDKPILRTILNKALKSIPPYEINKIKSKWLLEKRNERILENVDNEEDNENTLFLITTSIGLFLFLLLILIIITRFVSNDFIAKSFGSIKFRIIALIILSIVVFMLAVLVNLTLEENKKTALSSAKSDLEFVLKTTQDRLDTWIEERMNFLLQIGRDAELVEATKLLLKVNKDKNSLKESVELKNVREFFKKREKEFGKLGFFIIDREFISIGSRRDTNLGSTNLIAKYNPKLLEKVFQGETVFIPPIETDVTIKANKNISNEHTMFFAIPIQDKDGNVIAVMTQRLDVEGKFSDIIQSGRLGQSGESYLFSKDGFMLTKSRFRNELIEIGLLKADEKEYEKVKIKDPGGNLLEGYTPTALVKDMPLTKMAEAAISLDEKIVRARSRIHSNVEGYRDYRGVNVFGAWIWYKKVGIGLTTEVDEEEALSGFYILRQNLIIITSLTLLLTIMAVVMLIILGEKATRSVNKANNELNKLLESFDENVIASKTDARGIIKYASKAFCKVSGYTQEELIGSPQNIVRHPDMPKELFKDLWTTIQNGKIWKGEVKNKKKDGGFYWVEVVVTPEFDYEGKISGFSAIRQDITSKKEVEELSGNLEVKIEERTSELKESQKKFSTLFDAAPDSIIIIKDGQVIDCNQKTLDLFGVNSHEEFMKNDFKALSPEYQENEIKSEILAPQLIKKAISKGFSQFEWKHKRIDNGEIFDAEVILATIKINNEVNIYGVVRDISERKKAQQKIADQKQYIDSIMNSQSNIVISTDGEKLRTANKAFFDFFSVKDVDEFLNTLGECICDTFDINAPKEFIQKMMGEEKWIEYVYNRPEQIHKAIIEKDGQKHIFSITSDRFEFAGETLEVAVFTDITEIEAIRSNIETILSNIMLPVLITSKQDRVILYANDYASKQYGAKIEDLVGSSIDSVYTKLGQKDEILEKMSVQGYVENLEEKYKTKEGKEFIGLLSVKPITYNQEEAYIGMVVDITKQKEIEEEIRRIHKHTQSSIEYASLIQHSLIPSNDLFRKYFDDYFTIWHPKDIVGGDIYLFEELRNEDECLLMVIDCTGHGVPGAFVTMLVKAIERQIAAIIASDINMEVSPAWILKYFNQTMKKLLKQESDDAISNAGLDAAVLYYNKKEEIIKFAGSELPLFYIEDGIFKIIKGDRHSIGYKKSNANYEFKEHIIDAREGSQFYLTTDGYLDQNGGEKGFPFGKKRFQKLLEEYKSYSFADQQEVLLNAMQDYQKDEERNDDISIVGIKIGKEDSLKDNLNESWTI